MGIAAVQRRQAARGDQWSVGWYRSDDAQGKALEFISNTRWLANSRAAEFQSTRQKFPLMGRMASCSAYAGGLALRLEVRGESQWGRLLTRHHAARVIRTVSVTPPTSQAATNFGLEQRNRRLQVEAQNRRDPSQRCRSGAAGSSHSPHWMVKWRSSTPGWATCRRYSAWLVDCGASTVVCCGPGAAAKKRATWVRKSVSDSCMGAHYCCTGSSGPPSLEQWRTRRPRSVAPSRKSARSARAAPGSAAEVRAYHLSGAIRANLHEPRRLLGGCRQQHWLQTH